MSSCHNIYDYSVVQSDEDTCGSRLQSLSQDIPPEASEVMCALQIPLSIYHAFCMVVKSREQYAMKT